MFGRTVAVSLVAALAMAVAAIALACSSPAEPRVDRSPPGALLPATQAVVATIEPPKEPIVFADLNWDSAQLQNRIAQYIVEKGYGYPSRAEFGGTLELFEGLRRGEIDVTMEIWLPNQDEAWEDAQVADEVISAGRSLSGVWQSAFVIPAYIQEQHPELNSVEDLKDPQYRELFATAETDGKARLMSCLVGWACDAVNTAQIAGYALSEHVHLVNPGTREIANAELYRLYAARKPWLGYQESLNEPVLLLDLVRLAEPEYSDRCWHTTKACAYEDATVLIGVNPELAGRTSEVMDMLRKWHLDTESYTRLARWRIEQDASYADAAIWWLNNNEDVWAQWVTVGAAGNIRVALAAGERADGWPNE